MLGQIVNPQHRNNGFHTTGTVGTFVAGAVASKLLNLDENQTLNALGLCGTQAAGLLESDHNGSMGKVLHVGKAVYNGLISAFLALNGFTGAGTIFDGDEGFLKTMVLSDSDFSLDVALKNMGKVRVRDIYFKKYPFCRHLHSSIDTVLKLKASIGEEYEHIGNVIIKTYDVAAKHDNYNPKNVEELKQSLPYAVAIMLVCGEIDLDDLNQLIEFGLLDSYSTVDKVNSIKNLASKIIIVSDSGLDELYPNKRPSNVIIKLDESFRGGIFQNITLLPKGDFENPYQLKDLIDKFKSLNPDFDLNKLLVVDNIEDYLDDVCKISIFHHNCAEKMVSQEFVDKWSKTMNIAVSGKFWLDCTNQGGNKGSALQHFQEAYKISPDETLAFGDNINDIEMLKRASHSFAVENAREEVKEVANFIAPSYKEDGVLQVLKAVLRGELA